MLKNTKTFNANAYNKTTTDETPFVETQTETPWTTTGIMTLVWNKKLSLIEYSNYDVTWMTLIRNVLGLCNPDFVDSYGFNCEDYAIDYCTECGGYGRDWPEGEGETFEKYANDGEDATVCPQCGCQGNSVTRNLIV